MLRKCYQRRLIRPTFGALVLENELQYHGLAVRVNSAYDASISCENFVKFGPVAELIGLICEGMTWRKNWRISSNISEYTGPIFTIFLPYESAFGADYKSGLCFSNLARDVAMASK